MSNNSPFSDVAAWRVASALPPKWTLLQGIYVRHVPEADINRPQNLTGSVENDQLRTKPSDL
jgi:hypothetical protein